MNDTVATAEPQVNREKNPGQTSLLRLDIHSLHAQLQQTVFADRNESDVFAGLTEFLRRLLGAVAVAGFAQDANGALTCAHRLTAEQGGRLPAEAPLLEQWAASACRERRCRSTASNKEK